MDAQRIMRDLQRDFRAKGDPERAKGEKAYLKSDLDFYGITVPYVRKVAMRIKRDHPNAARDDVLNLVQALWRTRYHELRSVGIGLLDQYADLLQARDMALVEDILRRANTWAHVDWLAVRVAGDLAERYATARRVLSRWSRDDNFWVRRSCLLAFLTPLKAGRGDFDQFARYASGMIEEKEFFIRKAIGWVLREVGKNQPELSYAFLLKHIDTVSGLTMREGAKYLPADMKKRLGASE